MSKLLELREKRVKLWEGAKAFLASKQDENGDASNEDLAVYDKMEAEVTDMTNKIKLLERQDEMDAEIASVASQRPILNYPSADINNLTSSFMLGKPLTGRESHIYTNAFWNAMRYNNKVFNDLSVGIDSAGGYLVPDEFHRRLIEALEEYNIMRKLSRIIRTSSGDLHIPVAATRGTAAWVEEAGVIPTSDTNFGQVTLGAYKLGTMIKVSHELLNDSAFPLESFLATDFGRRMGTLEEEAFLVGDGNKKPTGVLSSAQVGVTTEYQTEITFDDVMDLYHSLKSPYRNKAVFIANDLTVKALRKLKDGNGQFLWNPSVVTGTPDTVLGRPL